MRRVLYKKTTSLQNHSKAISVSESSEDKECKTFVKKNFVYMVNSVPAIDPALPPPDIYIKKVFDSKDKEERFSFRITGVFYINQSEGILKVDFCHSLNINIIWKAKVFSPKSVTLT